MALAQRLNDYENHKDAPKKDIFLIGPKDGVRKGLAVDRRSGGVIAEQISYDVSFTLEHADKDKEMFLFLSLWGGFEKAVSISGFPRLLYAEAKCKWHIYA